MPYVFAIGEMGARKQRVLYPSAFNDKGYNHILKLSLAPG